ncbi:MAG: precorrin-6A/cobalt-precorrin-6A reductase [Rhodobacteraceae bacterium]|nr:precorrin-6A/cobalt-precorrin-6A reductase [Paracoccaceae bacterium]
MKLALIGGSREADLLERALGAAGIEVDPSGEIAVVAPHPFDTDLWECAALSLAGKPHIGLARAGWQPEVGDSWTMAANAEDAAEILAASGAKCASLAVGNGRLAPFYRLSNIELCIRSRNAPHPPLPPRGRVRSMRGPFDVAGEVAELEAQGIDTLVVHNAGGRGGWPKLGAARELGIPVILIERPKLPPMEMVETVEAALAWALRHAA